MKKLIPLFILLLPLTSQALEPITPAEYDTFFKVLNTKVAACVDIVTDQYGVGRWYFTIHYKRLFQNNTVINYFEKQDAWNFTDLAGKKFMLGDVISRMQFVEPTDVVGCFAQ